MKSIIGRKGSTVTHKQAELTKSVMNGLSSTIKVEKFIDGKSFTPKIGIVFSISSEDIQDVCALHGEAIASQMIGDCVLLAISEYNKSKAYDSSTSSIKKRVKKS